MPRRKFAFVASPALIAQEACGLLAARYGDVPAKEADVIVALGGDGFMLSTLHRAQALPAPVYGMNRGTIGFLMNAYSETDLMDRLHAAEEEVINPLSMKAKDQSGQVHSALAINEVSLLRAGPQAAKLRITVDGRLRLSELVCDGALLATPAGSTAYNYSAHGPILPIGADVLALTAIAAFRPRRWRGLRCVCTRARNREPALQLAKRGLHPPPRRRNERSTGKRGAASGAANVELPQHRRG